MSFNERGALSASVLVAIYLSLLIVSASSQHAPFLRSSVQGSESHLLFNSTWANFAGGIQVGPFLTLGKTGSLISAAKENGQTSLRISADTVDVVGSLQSASIETSILEAVSISADVQSVNTLTSGLVTATSIEADNLVAAQLDATSLVSTSAVIDQLSTISHSTGTISTESLVCSNSLSANSVSAESISTSTLQSTSTLTAESIYTGSLHSTSTLTAESISTSSLNSTSTLTAKSVNAEALTATSIITDTLVFKTLSSSEGMAMPSIEAQTILADVLHVQSTINVGLFKPIYYVNNVVDFVATWRALRNQPFTSPVTIQLSPGTYNLGTVLNGGIFANSHQVLYDAITIQGIVGNNGQVTLLGEMSFIGVVGLRLRWVTISVPSSTTEYGVHIIAGSRIRMENCGIITAASLKGFLVAPAMQPATISAIHGCTSADFPCMSSPSSLLFIDSILKTDILTYGMYIFDSFVHFIRSSLEGAHHAITMEGGTLYLDDSNISCGPPYTSCNQIGLRMYGGHAHVTNTSFKRFALAFRLFRYAYVQVHTLGLETIDVVFEMFDAATVYTNLQITQWTGAARCRLRYRAGGTAVSAFIDQVNIVTQAVYIPVACY